MIYQLIFNSFSLIQKKYRLIDETSNRIVILVINIAIVQIAIPIQSSVSGAGFYACEVGKTWSMVIRKNIRLLA